MHQVLVGEGTSALVARWWVPVIRGAAAILFGLLAFAMPKASLLALVYVWGAYAIVDGASSLVQAARRGRAGLRWGWITFEGIVGIAAGAVALAWPGITAFILLVVIATWALLTGVAKIAAAIALRRHIEGEWLLGASGVLSVAFGALLLARPSAGALAVVWMIAAYAILLGVMLIGLGLRLHHLKGAVARPLPDGGAPTTA